MKKLIIALSFLAVANASSAKTETPSKTEANSNAYTYYVIGIAGPNYLLASNPNNPGECSELSGSPCNITSTNPMSGTAPKAQVDSQTNGFTIESYQDQLL